MVFTIPTRRRSNERGFTLIELLVVVAVVGVVAAIATPGLLRSRIAANEASAVGSLRAIISAQQTFASLQDGFADDLATLGGTCPGATSSFVSPDLGSNGVLKSGYTFDVVAGAGALVGPTDCFGNPTRTTYYGTATPETVGTTGSRGFATNTDSAIWQDETGAVPAEPFSITASVSPLGR